VKLVIHGFVGSKASLEEYEVAAALEQRNVLYIYQADFKLFSGLTTKVDFYLPNEMLVFFVMGDHFHQGMDQRIYDREQEIAVMGDESHPNVIEIWGHDVVSYPGFPTPTDESFNTMIDAALRGIQTGSAWGSIS
jgi:hypothetical protein